MPGHISNTLPPITILRLKQVEIRTGLSCSTIYERIADGTFPRQISLGGGRAVGWIELEINQWIEERIQQSRENPPPKRKRLAKSDA